MTDHAPPGKIWFCMMCGKMSTRLSNEAGGWDESCAMNSIAIDQGRRGPTQEQREQFGKAHAAAIHNGLKAIADLAERIRLRSAALTPKEAP